MMYVSPTDDFTAQLLSSDRIVLQPQQIDWAIDLSQMATTEAESWQTYLSGMALLGMQQWLTQQSAQLLKSRWLLPPGQLIADPTIGTRLSQNVSRCRVGNSGIYLVVTDCLADPLVSVPRSIATQNHRIYSAASIGYAGLLIPDYYVLVAVMEELSIVELRGYLSQIQLSCLLHEFNPALSSDSIGLPSYEFDPDLNHLLRQLQEGNHSTALPE